jgi:hypothetical protein
VGVGAPVDPARFAVLSNYVDIVSRTR